MGATLAGEERGPMSRPAPTARWTRLRASTATCDSTAARSVPVEERRIATGACARQWGNESARPRATRRNRARSVEAYLAQDADVVVDARPHREHERHPEEEHAAGVEVDLEAGARNRIAVVQEERLEREHLEDHLVLAELLRGECDAAARGDAAEPRDGELAQYGHHHHPGGHARLGRDGGEHDESGGDDELVGERIEELAERGRHAVAAREPAVQEVRDARDQERERGHG